MSDWLKCNLCGCLFPPDAGFHHLCAKLVEGFSADQEARIREIVRGEIEVLKDQIERALGVRP